jgi:cell division septal protein FtsQ
MTKHQKHTKTKDSATSGSINPLPWIATAILVLGLAVLGGLHWSSTVTVNQIQFKGNNFITTADLEMVKVPTGIKPDSMDFVEIINRFEQLPYVKRADISVEPNGNLLVTISERQPIALLADGNKKIYVDKEGIRLPLVLGKTVDIPILYGFSASPMSDTLKSEAFKRVSNFLTMVHERAVSNATISELAWTQHEGIVALTNQNGVKLIFGKGDYDRRLRNWEAFYSKIVKQKGINKMRSVDLRFHGQIVTREE